MAGSTGSTSSEEGAKVFVQSTNVGLQHQSQTQRPRNIFQRGWDRYCDGVGAIVGWISRGFAWLGAYTALNPGKVLWGSLLIGILICIGWARFRLESSADVLWVPQSGKARDDAVYARGQFPRSRQGGSFYAQLKEDKMEQYGGDSALQLSVAWEMFQLHNKVMAISVPGKAGRNMTFADMCLKNADGKTCDNSNGFLWYWYKNMTIFLNDIQGSPADPTAGNQTAFEDRVSSRMYPDGSPVALLSVFGGTTFNFNPFQIKTAKVLASDYTLDYKTVSSKMADDWCLKLIDLLKEELPKQQYMTYTFITGSSVSEELGKAITGDMMLVIISLLVFIIITIIVLSKFDLVKTRTTLALGGILAIAVGIMSGWGWGMIFGMPFTPLQQLSPFILLGMGVDVIFILVKAYEIIIQRQPDLPLEQSFSKLMATAGVSVLVSLLASVAAFALGSVDVLNSVIWFSAYSTMNAIMIMFMMLTFFVACMVYTERRILAGRLDFCCCARRASATKNSSNLPVGHPVGSSAGSESGYSRSESRVVADDAVEDENVVKRFFRKYYAPLLTRWYIKVLIILIFTAWGAASWVSIYSIKYGQPLADLATDGSYLQDYDREQKETFGRQVGEPAGLYFRNLDFSSPDIQYKMLKAWDMVLQADKFNASNTGFQGNWLVSFISWAEARGGTVVMPANNCYNPLIGKIEPQLQGVVVPIVINGCVPQASFYTLFNQWWISRGNTSNDIVRKSDGTISGCRFTAMQTASEGDDRYNTNLMTEVRRVEKDINSQLFSAENDVAGTYTVFVYGRDYNFAEGDKLLPTSALTYFLLALAGVFVVSTLMLVNPGAALLMVISVGLVDLLLFGELWALDIRFNQVSVINMIMATGLAVDYSVYFAQKFMTVKADGTLNGRMVLALADTGSAVFLGGLTALCGSVPMAFAKSVIIRTFFRLIFGTIIFSLLVGLLLMPVVFSISGLPPVKSVLMEDDDVPLPPLSQGTDAKEKEKTLQ